MKKHKSWKGLTIGLFLLALTGCGMGADEGTGEKDISVTEQYQSNISNTEDMVLDEKEKNHIAPEINNADSNGNNYNNLVDEGVNNGVDTVTENQNNTTLGDTNDKVDADSLYESANLTGSVVDFLNSSCTVSPSVTEDDGKTGVIAAPGYENEDMNVTVTYEEECLVQIATIHTSTGVAELKQASVSDIKKQASIIIYGSFEDTHHISATRIIICHRTD